MQASQKMPFSLNGGRECKQGKVFKYANGDLLPLLFIVIAGPIVAALVFLLVKPTAPVETRKQVNASPMPVSKQ
jgi:hypothetical protein